MKYVYFVTYNFKHAAGFGFGNIEITLKHPLQSIDGVKEMERTALESVQLGDSEIRNLLLSSAPALLRTEKDDNDKAD